MIIFIISIFVRILKATLQFTKSDPYIVMVSTPNAPDLLFDSIEKEPEETCIYRKLFLDYKYGLDRIYTKQEIEKAKRSPSYKYRCYLLLDNIMTCNNNNLNQKNKKTKNAIFEMFVRKLPLNHIV